MEQQVLAAPRHRLYRAGLEAGFTPAERARSIMAEVLESGDFLPRERAERDPEWLQPIPCGLLHSDYRVLVLERQEKSRSHRLHGSLVLWAGGHVQMEDAALGPSDLFLAALNRELDEELDLVVGRPELQGVVSDGKSMHFALVFDVPAVAPETGTVGANSEFRLSKGASPSGYFLELEALERSFKKLESWSKIILADILQRRGRGPALEAAGSQFEFDFPHMEPALLVRNA